MAEIKPVLNNFSSGEITPDAFGMVGSPAFASGAQELLNMMPVSMGGAARRGAMEYIATIPGGDSARLIPWSVDDERDFLLVLTANSAPGLSDGKLRILDVSLDIEGTCVNQFLLENDGVTVFERPLSYTASQLAQVKYAQTIRKIILAQADHKMWYVKLDSIDTDDDVTFIYTLEVGDIRFTGQWAISTEVKSEADLNSDPIMASYFKSVFGSIEKDTVYTIAGHQVSGFINDHPVASIERKEISTPRKFYYDFKGWTSSREDGWKVDGGSKLPDSSAVKKWKVGPSESRTLFSFDDNAVATTILNLCEQHGLNSRTAYKLWSVPDSIINSKRVGSLAYYKAEIESTFTIVFSDAHPTLTITGTTSNLTGYMQIGSLGLKVNNKVTPGSDLMDRVGIWMTPNIPYECDPGYDINGVSCISAELQTRDDGEPVIVLTSASTQSFDGASTFSVSRKDTVTGRLSVNLTPFSRAEENPGFVAFHQNRLVIGGSKLEPNTIYMSKSNDYESFIFFEDIEYEKTVYEGEGNYITSQQGVQQITASSAIKFQIATEENEAVRWGASVEDLIIGTDTSEWVVPSDITALNPRIILTTRNGSTDMQGRFVNGMVVYIPRSRRGARVFEPKLNQMSPDILQHANHMVRGSSKEIIAFDYRADPRQELLMLRRDGTLLVGVMGEGSIGWYQVQTRPGDVIESVAGIAAYGEDAVYVVVKRAVDTGFIRTIERMRTMDDDVFADRVYLDSYVSVADTTIQITLPRLYTGIVPATWPMILYADGTYGRLVMNAGGIANNFVDSVTGLGVALSTKTGVPAVIGYPYTSRIKTMRIDAIDTEGLPKSGGAMHLRVLRSGDLALRREYESESNIHIATPVTSLGVRIYPYTGSIRLENMAPSAVDQCIILENDNVTIGNDIIPRAEPMTIQLISPIYSVGDAI
jgi:hypothetical protein